MSTRVKSFKDEKFQIYLIIDDSLMNALRELLACSCSLQKKHSNDTELAL